MGADGPVSPVSLRGDTRREEPTRGERQLGRRAAESRATVPDVELTVAADVSALAGALAKDPGSPPTTAALVRAAALALRRHPRVNGAYRDGAIELYSRINIGVWAGTAVPVILDADAKDMRAIERAIETQAKAADDGSTTAADLAGATFSLYDLGRIGVDGGSVPVPSHQAAALTAGTVRAVPVIRGQAIVPGQEMTLTLTCDHRILDLPRAAAFLTGVQTLLTSPEGLGC